MGRLTERHTEPSRQYRPLQKMGGLTLQYCQCRGASVGRGEDEEHGSFSVSLVDRGVFSYRNARGDAMLGPGWLMLGNEGEAYVCSHEHGGGDDCVVLDLSAEIYDAIQSALGQVGGPFTRPALPPLPRVAALLKSLVASGDDGFALEETALAVVAAIQRDISGAAPAAAPHERARAATAARYIEDHAAERLSLAGVAGEVGLSPFHFLRSFRRAMGITPHQYLMRMRLIRAIGLLSDTAMPVTAIGYEAGWADLSNFIRTFRRDVGCSPREFRRKGILRGRRGPGSRRSTLPVS
jgi:AraC family transcriptional regulator